MAKGTRPFNGVELLEPRRLLASVVLPMSAGPLAFDAKRDRLYVIHTDDIERYDQSSGQQLAPWTIPGANLTDLDITLDGSSAYVLDTNGFVHRINLDTGAVHSIPAGKDNRRQIAIASDGAALFSSGSPGELKRLDLASEAITEITRQDGFNVTYGSIRRSGDHRFVFLFDSIFDGPANYYDANSHTFSAPADGRGSIGALAVNRDGSRLLTRGGVLLDRTFATRLTLPAVGGTISAGTFSEDGKLTFVGDDANVITAFDAASGDKLFAVNAIADPYVSSWLRGVRNFVVSDDGSRAYLWATDGVRSIDLPNSASGTAFDDRNRDRTRDTNEPPLVGARVYADVNGDGNFRTGEPTTVTDSAGRFTLYDIAPGGAVKLRIEASGYRIVGGDNFLTTAVPKSGAVTGVSIAATNTATVRGRVFDDRNVSGTVDDAEPGLSGRTVFLDADDDGVLDAGERSVITGASGAFSFDVPSGTYHVRVTPKAGWRQLIAAGDAALAGGDVSPDFALAETTRARVAGYVFVDTDLDGVRDVNEPGRAGSRVFIDRNGDGVWQHDEPGATTNAKGRYLFNGLEAGTHVVRFVKQGGLKVTSKGRGRYTVTLGSGATNSKHFGVRETSTVRYAAENPIPPDTFVADLYPVADPYDDGPSRVIATQGLNLFYADDGLHGYELWRTDGTGAGTRLLKDIDPGEGGSVPYDFTSFNGAVYFTANSQIWRTDGTAAGTVVVQDDPTKTYFDFPTILGVTNSTLYFTDGQSVFGGTTRLFATDGTWAGTRRVASFDGYNNQVLDAVAMPDGHFVFVADTLRFGPELWLSNGTAAGTGLLKDINATTFWTGGDEPGGYGSNPRGLLRVGSKVLFLADETDGGVALWSTDGTKAGTVRVKSIGGSASLTPVLMNGNYYFVTTSLSEGATLWRSDGTVDGTVALRIWSPGSTVIKLRAKVSASMTVSSVIIGGGGEPMPPSGLVATDDAVYYYDGATLYRTDGTAGGAAGGAVMVRGNLKANEFIGVGTRIYFTEWKNYDDYAEYEGAPGLWTSDGTPFGTYEVTPIDVMSQTLSRAADGSLLFTARNPWERERGWQLHRIDPRPANVTGVAFNDGNGDGVRQAGESGLGSMKVYLDLDRDQIHQANEPSVTTAADGSYVFDDLLAGSGIARPENLSAGKVVTTNTSSALVFGGGKTIASLIGVH